MTPDLAELRRLLDDVDSTPWSVPEGDLSSVTDAEGWCVASCVYGSPGDRGAHEAALIAAAVNALPALLDAAAERDALAVKVERVTGELVDAGYRQAEDHAEIEALRSQLAGRCLSDITHRDEEHRQSFCMLPAYHAPLAHDDCMGCTWTDGEHWQPQAVDRLADELARIADESQHEGWDSPAVRRVVDRLRAAFEEPQP